MLRRAFDGKDFVREPVHYLIPSLRDRQPWNPYQVRISPASDNTYYDSLLSGISQDRGDPCWVGYTASAAGRESSSAPFFSELVLVSLCVFGVDTFPGTP